MPAASQEPAAPHGFAKDATRPPRRKAEQTEKDVSAARRFYWAAVAEYNVAVRSVPTAIVAGVHGFLPLPDPTISAKLAAKPDYGISV